ncbi:YlbF family regulator [Paenibacillus sp. LHD-38]|uniref:YlbF family regulator n=1 Tax=Paenibacillus sp. LHD-38 TaxID=3072143 RepID=UPI00280F46AF|nr:YlbF family regulator [Paenibacillus sp. LHD-38]MDQ8739193.1 YlbF family regulator [Paenibacillus sp. LHD-38]
MNVYDKAYELAKALKDSEEAKLLKLAKEEAEANPEAKSMLDDFRERQTFLQQKMMAGEEPSAEDMEKMNKLYEVISQNPLIGKLLDAERRFAVVFEDVNRIMSDVLKSIVD